MKIRVLQGHSICYRGIWFNQGDVLEVETGTEFTTNRPKHDAEGKRLGDEVVSQVETIEDPAPPRSSKQKKEEG